MHDLYFILTYFPPSSRDTGRTFVRRYIVYSENPVDCKIFAEWQMRVVSRSTYISQFPDVIAQKALLGSMRRDTEGAASRRKCRSKRRRLRGRRRRGRRRRGRRILSSVLREDDAGRCGGRGECREGAVDKLMTRDA